MKELDNRIKYSKSINQNIEKDEFYFIFQE
mgnify:CR=1 FL=1